MYGCMGHLVVAFACCFIVFPALYRVPYDLFSVEIDVPCYLLLHIALMNVVVIGFYF